MSTNPCLTLFGHEPDLFCPRFGAGDIQQQLHAVIFLITHRYLASHNSLYDDVMVVVFCVGCVLWAGYMLTYLLTKEWNAHAERWMLIRSSVNFMWSRIENLLRPTAWCAAKIKPPHTKCHPKPKFPLWCYLSLPQRYFKLSSAYLLRSLWAWCKACVEINEVVGG